MVPFKLCAFRKNKENKSQQNPGEDGQREGARRSVCRKTGPFPCRIRVTQLLGMPPVSRRPSSHCLCQGVLMASHPLGLGQRPSAWSQGVTKHSSLRAGLGPKPSGKVATSKLSVAPVVPHPAPPPWVLLKLEEAVGTSSAPTCGCQIAATD